MRFLILANLGDETALRVYAALRKRHGGGRVRIVSGEELVLAPRWTHRLEDCRTATEIRLADGTVLAPGGKDVVFNRIRHVTAPHFAASREEDRDYAVMETRALWLSWLSSLPCPVVNPPTARDLGAPDRSLPEWLLLAGRAGLPVRGYAFTTDPRSFRERDCGQHRRRNVFAGGRTVLESVASHPVGGRPAFFLEPTCGLRQRAIIAGCKAIGTAAGLFAKPLRRLAALSGCALLQVTFAVPARAAQRGGDTRGLTVCDITAFPQVRDAGAVSAIADMLESGPPRPEAPG